MKTITLTQLRDKLAALKSATPIAFSALTKVDARKTGRVCDYGSEVIASDGTEAARRNLRFIKSPFNELFKLSRVQAFTGNSYTPAVQRQQIREGQSPTFHATARAWGEQFSPALIQKGPSWYLAVQVLRGTRPLYMDKTPDGLKLVKTDAVAPFLPPPSPSFRQQLEKPIVRRDYSLESIVSIALGGERYKVIHNRP